MLASYISPLREYDLRQQNGGKATRTTLKDAPVTLPRVIGNIIPSLFIYCARVDEVLVQMASEFENVPFHCSRYYNIVDQASTDQPAPLLTEDYREKELTSNE